MIEVRIHPNGLAIYGHSNPVTCAEVSILFWACGRYIQRLGGLVYECGADMSGIGVAIFDVSQETVKQTFEHFGVLFREWADVFWVGRVRITDMPYILDAPKAGVTP